jgi:hypothetical protein
MIQGTWGGIGRYRTILTLVINTLILEISSKLLLLGVSQRPNATTPHAISTYNSLSLHYPCRRRQDGCKSSLRPFADAADRLAARIDAAVPVTICGELTEIRHRTSNKTHLYPHLQPHIIQAKKRSIQICLSPLFTFPSSRVDNNLIDIESEPSDE